MWREDVQVEEAVEDFWEQGLSEGMKAGWWMDGVACVLFLFGSITSNAEFIHAFILSFARSLDRNGNQCIVSSARKMPR